MIGWGAWTAATAIEAGLLGALLVVLLDRLYVPPRWSSILLLLVMLQFLAPPVAHLPHFRPVSEIPLGGPAGWLDQTVHALALAQAAGLALGLGLIAISAVRLRRARRRGTPVETGPVAEALREVMATASSEARPPELYLAGVGAPLATGLFRPTILLPPEAARLAPEALRMILAHEVAHLRRRDPIAAAIRLIMLSLWWFHPVAWLVARRHRHEVELGADQAVVPAFGAAADYCQLLISSPGGRPGLPGVAATLRPGGLEARFRALLQPIRRPRCGLLPLGVLVLISAVAIPVRVLEPIVPGHETARVRVVAPDPVVVIIPSNMTRRGR